jgi:cytochrome P450
MGSSRKDIFSHLLQTDTQSGRSFNQKELNTNANLIIAAGADTTSNVMSQVFRVLAIDQESKKATGQQSIISKLRNEIDTICDKGVQLTSETIRNAKYLDGVVSEALRLMNPLPMGVQTVTPPQGLEIAGRHIPGHVAVRAPPMLLMSDERYFPFANEFIPERWTGERPELLTDLSWKAYIPFGYGVHSCVGKNLALNELRLVTARLVREFDVSFTESYDDDEFKRQTKDYIILESGPVWLKFNPRIQ